MTFFSFFHNFFIFQTYMVPPLAVFYYTGKLTITGHKKISVGVHRCRIRWREDQRREPPMSLMRNGVIHPNS